MEVYGPHLARKAAVLETPEKPVTTTAPVGLQVRSLARVLGASPEEALAFERVYESARNDLADVRWATILGYQWQALCANVPDDDVAAPFVNELHHQIADLLEDAGAPGSAVRVGGGSITCPTRIRLPCRQCGHMLVSEYRGGRLRRTCGLCFPYSPAPPEHPRGGLTLSAEGVYPHRRAGRTLGVEQHGQDVLCAHPECLALFVATRGDEEYCPEHRGRREEARRLRSRSGLPKHERFRFRLAPGMNSVLYHHGPDALEVRILPGDIRVAQDENELRELAAFLLRGTLTVDS
jgi:hypothetical protein